MKISLLKKISVLLSVIIISLFCLSTSYAKIENSQNKSEKVLIINEYDYINSIKNANYIQLKNLNLSQIDISKIKSIDYKAEILKRKQLDNQILTSMGYSENEIKILKNFSGSEAEMQALAGELYYTSKKDHHYYNSSNKTTYAGYTMRFTWTKTPIMQFSDIIAASWSEGFLVNKTSSKVLLTYKLRDGSYYNKKAKNNLELNTFSSKFEVSNTVPYTPHYFIKSGKLTLRLYKKGRIKNIACVMKYGHTILNVKPSISISNGISFSFTPSFGVKTEYSNYIPSTL